MDTEKYKLQGGQLAVWLASEFHPINFAMMARVRGRFPTDQLQHALAKLQHKYTPLSMRVEKDPDGSVCLVPAPGIDIPVTIVERQHPDKWADTAALELEQVFDMYNHPPLRLVLLRDEDTTDMLFVCPHALADGFAVVYLVRDLLTLLTDPDAEVFPLPHPMSIGELIPDFSGKSLSMRMAALKAGMMRLFLALSSGKKNLQNAEMPQSSSRYQALPWALTHDQTSALAVKCRTEGTTIHTALCTAFLQAFGEFYSEGWKRRIQSPVSLRNRLTSPVGESFGLYVNLVEFPVDVNPVHGFWEVARRIKEEFVLRTGDRYIFNSLIDANAVMRKLQGRITPEFVANNFEGTNHDLSITNLGRLDMPLQYGPLQLEALFGPILGGDPEDIVLGVTTINSKMFFCLSFTDLKLNTSQAKKITTSAMARLAKAVDSR